MRQPLEDHQISISRAKERATFPANFTLFATMNGLRIFGSGGYFGYSGYFYKTKIGLFKLLATEDTGHYLRIQRKGSKRPLYIAYRPTQS